VEARGRDVKAVWGLTAAFLAEIFGWAWAYSLAGHVSFGLALYFVLETGTTVGYGDVVPHSAGTHWLAVAMFFTVIPTLGLVFARYGAVHLSRLVHHKTRAAEESARKAHQIAADLYRAQTGQAHPEAP
jgi:hypothetical protein